MVTITINEVRRNRLKRLHTATHLVNYAANKILGNHVWQNGSNLKEMSGSLDITHYKQLTLDEIHQIEQEIEQLISKGLDVTIEELNRSIAEEKYGYTLYQGGAIPMEVLRVVHVGEIDIEACGGTHVGNTKEVGNFKIINSTKLQDGVIRLSYVIGEFALKEIQTQEKYLQETAQVLSVEKKDCAKTAEKFFNEWKNQKKDIENLEKEVFELHKNSVSTTKSTTYTITSQLSMKLIQELFEIGNKTNKEFTLITNTVILSTQESIDEEYKKQIKRGDFYQYIK